MNIFILHKNPVIASKFHVDKHIVKMPLETAQMLCTAHWKLGSVAPYKEAYKNHPCNVWIVQSIENYNWLCKLGIELCKEYTFRYGKVHKCQAIIEWCINNKPKLPNVSMTMFALAMPDEFKTKSNAVKSYRMYYCKNKSHIHKWSKRNVPKFINTTYYPPITPLLPPYYTPITI